MPNRKPEYVDPLEDYYALIGKITILLSRIEFEIEGTLESLVQIKAASGAPTKCLERSLQSDTGLSNRVNLWQKYLKEHSSIDSKIMASTYKKARAAIDKRNKLVHAAVATLGCTGEMFFLKRKKSHAIEKTEELKISLEDLHSLIEDIEEIENVVGAGCMHYQVEYDNWQEALGYEHDQMF